MLFRQNLRRRHERRLITSLNREQNRRDRDHCLSRADITLQKPIHRILRGQITLDLGDDLFLCCCQFKWKRVQEFLHQFPSPAMRGAYARVRVRSPGRDEHLHREEFRKDEVLTRDIKRLPCFGEMNRADRFAAISIFQVLRQQRLNRLGIKLLKKPINHAAQRTLRKTFGRRIDRRDPAEMDRSLLVVLNHFELGMIHANPLPAQSRLAENDELLAGSDHFLDVMQIEPATDQRLTERVCVQFLQCRLENLFPTTETPKRRLDHFAG